MRYFCFALIFLSVGIACKTQPENDAALNAVIDEDGRENQLRSQYRNVVGLFMTPRGPCTGFVSGQQEITTAGHCVEEKDKLEPFLFSLDEGRIEANVTAIKSRHGDILTLTTSTSFKEILPKARLNLADQVSAVTFRHEEQLLSKQEKCSLKNSELPGALLHDCDTEKGASGAPLLQNGAVVGVHVGHAPKLNLNLGLDLAHEQAPEVSKLRSLFDSDLEVSCGTDCYKHCRRKVLGRWVLNPVCESSCLTERLVACTPAEVKICGQNLAVSAAVLGTCSAALVALKPACSAGAAATAGSSCAIAADTASSVCGIASGTLKVAAISCIALSTGGDPKTIRLEW